MKQVEVCVDLGTKATFFGLGLLASKKMRPYAKYFIVGGLALSAAPVIMQLVEKNKLNRIQLEEQVDEVVVENEASCCEEETSACGECCEAIVACCQDEVAEPCDAVCEDKDCDCPEESPEA